MGETHFHTEGHFQMLFIFSPSVNDPIRCNSRGFFAAPLPQLCRILRLLSLSVHGPLTVLSSLLD